MNDEVKEILEQLLIVSNKELPLFILGEEYAKILYDYITNLQEKNERLNTELNAYKDEFCKDAIKKYELIMELEDYKSRCEKAIEYINTKEIYYGEISKYDAFNKDEIGIELLSILNGGDE